MSRRKRDYAAIFNDTKPAGRPLGYTEQPRTVIEIMRKHLYMEGKTVSGDLAKWWGVKPESASRRMCDYRKAFTPVLIKKFVVGIGLDEFDAAELYLQAAKEAGWPIKPDLLKI